MAKREIIWTPRALQNRNDIFEYWYFKNGSDAYPKKLERLFNSAIGKKASEPESGRPFNLNRKIRYALVRNFRIYYTYTANVLAVLSIWDSRRNPSFFEI